MRQHKTRQDETRREVEDEVEDEDEDEDNLSFLSFLVLF
jgi:hypothetical protein